ncbi:MAG: hypothetical protein JGK24_29090 [Microcoleus sp. PH2017_29_MFU_D_A]|uniref:hypothetical protein n=1 Tax=unclassified Microcoleus TaxID=2642155 RepID=UPI001D9E3F4F|nr:MULTISPECIES: hypothetical protein [unclassified Microcoleus]MCC3420515.1 hypothetical protein [Microcoleus sp. PH2017_07_MST_O_A]MCC3429458.1 hypothetical protein [Microcoleus sp. PH2017_04_SCI_O_A]MCC3443184.1 hypothetical protein [Microcoleus sp. PH2017_03_ELD_O_A]MCC3466892.1 hypothetical protein [Microcoleus sp. PH2017_06_SFM_O_A]MCC3505689.1 hypothetical protein [Microcoleus sp. PH2017_19_SFW_U_A]MCC3511118.1 hypothetical protein [Microcoleus sp. PH2017_17_BER_D_A]
MCKLDHRIQPWFAEASAATNRKKNDRGKRTKRKSLYRDAKAPEGRLATKTAAAMVA